jgi:spore coat protein U-like protein
MKRKIISFLCVLALSQSVFAQTTHSATATTKTSATLSSTCILNSGSLNFGLYNPNNTTNTTASSNITFTCTKGTVVSVNLNDSLVDYNAQSPSKVTNSVSYAETNGVQWARYMSGASSGAALSYNLYQDAAFSKIFGGTNWFVEITNHNVQVVATGSIQSIPVYGAVAHGQYIQPDSYTDIVPIELIY